MLKTRIRTALILVVLLLPAVFALPPFGWAIAATIVLALAAWEWGALAGCAMPGRWTYAGAVLVFLSCVVWASPAVWMPGAHQPAWVCFVQALASLFWLGVVPLWLRRRWPAQGPLGLAAGLFVLLPTWFALVHLRALGVGTLLAVLGLAWVADIAAYFAGRRFGRHKLAPAISPGKTWEGVAGAVLGVLVYGLLHGLMTGASPGPFSGKPLGIWLLVLPLLTAVSIVGDLFESLLKRQVGIKDSGNLLPGHGGVLDRIDSLTALLPVTSFLLLL
jgi:phosphatidate cytidylyltransferase